MWPQCGADFDMSHQFYCWVFLFIRLPLFPKSLSPVPKWFCAFLRFLVLWSHHAIRIWKWLGRNKYMYIILKIKQTPIQQATHAPRPSIPIFANSPAFSLRLNACVRSLCALRSQITQILTRPYYQFNKRTQTKQKKKEDRIEEFYRFGWFEMKFVGIYIWRR